MAQDTIQKKEERVESLTSDLQTKEAQVKALTQEVHSRVESFCNLAFKPSHEIIRRSNEVTNIMTKMQELEERSEGGVSTIYLSGIPGCGKTQIARQIGKEFFDKRAQESEGLTFVVTLNAETLETLADSYMDLARKLGVTEYTLTNLATLKEVSAKEKIQHLKRLILPKMKKASKWLMIADNVVDLSLVRSNLPPTASEEWGHGQVLITTQDSSSIPFNAPGTFHESLDKGMKEDEAIELLKKNSQISNHKEVEKVAELLEYQPLALAAAAFYVQTVVSNGSPNYGWVNYLETMDDGKRQETEQPLAAENLAYSRSMTTAIKIAINRVSESDEILRQTFCFLSLCANDSLPIEAAVDFVKARTTGKADELIRAKILKSSLITSLKREHDAPCYLKLHNIVHEVLTTASMPDFLFSEKVQCISAAIKTLYSLIEAERKLLRESEYACTKLRNITSHCKVLHEILATDVAVRDVLVKELTHSVTPGNVVSWLCATARVCCDLGKPSDAIKFSKSAFQSIKNITSARERDLLKAEVLCVRGKMLEEQCKRMLALSNFEEAMKIFQATHGEEHADTAEIYSTLGNLYIELQKFERAKKYHEKALSIRRNIYGEKHADVGSSYNSLGLVYSGLGEKNQAKQYYEKAISISREMYGEKHIDLAAGYSNLGLLYSDKRQHNQAKEYYEKALIIAREIYGEEHPDIATIYHNLASDYRSLQRYKEAKECDEKALMIRKMTYGEEHPDVTASYASLGVDYIELRQPTKAKKCTKMAKKIRTKISDQGESFYSLRYGYLSIAQQSEAKECNGRNLFFVNKSYGDVRTNSKERHKIGQAKEYEKKAMLITKKNLNDLQLAASYYNQAVRYRNLGQNNDAKVCDEKALMIRKRIYGEDHPTVAETYYTLAYDYWELGQRNEAIECEEKALMIKKKIYGEEHPEVAESYYKLAYHNRKVGQHKKAKEYEEKALMIRECLYGEENPQVAASYHNMAVDYRELGQHHEAKQCNDKALMIRKRIYGEEHPEVAASYHSLAFDYMELGQHNEAKECDEKALMISECIYGEENLQVAASYHNLAVDYRELGQLKEAKECKEKALMIRKRIYGEEHPE